MPWLSSQQRVHHLRMQAGLAVAVVDDRRADDRAGLLIAEHRADAAGVAQQRVARQLAQLLGLERDVAQCAQAGVHAIGALAAGNDALHDGLGIVDARPGVAGEFEYGAVTGNGGDVLPAHWGVGDDDCCCLGHR